MEVLKAILKNILDRLIAGDSIEQAISGAKSESEVKEIIISCDVCNFETKSKAGLKIHKTRIHKNDVNKCTSCDFVATNNVDIKEHDETQHNTKEGIRKRPAPSYECDVPHCPFTFDSKQKLIEHAQSQHSKCEQANEHSPSTSPSRKKIVISDNSIKDNGINDVEMEETEEISKSILAQLQMKIEQLELKIQEEKDEKEKMKVEIDQLKTKHASGSAFGGFTQKVKKKPFKIPSHLRSVANNHLTQLRGFKMRYCALPDGACLTNCLTAHISRTDDEEERKRNNRRVNEHIADHFDDYYQNKIILPYIETVGVGSNSRTVVCKTKEEFITHLRNEDSLCAFSNYQELLAIANMLNINVKVFSFGIGGDPMKCEWKEVFPDPAMADTAQFPKGLVPDMYLYHSDQTHYDLLVSEDHHLALLGMIVRVSGVTKCPHESAQTDLCM